MEKTRLDKLLTCSDSSSGSARLMSLYSNRSQHVRYEVLQSVTRTVGVTGNQRADELPKTALVKANIEMQTNEVKWVIWEKKQPNVARKVGQREEREAPVKSLRVLKPRGSVEQERGG